MTENVSTRPPLQLNLPSAILSEGLELKSWLCTWEGQEEPLEINIDQFSLEEPVVVYVPQDIVACIIVAVTKENEPKIRHFTQTLALCPMTNSWIQRIKHAEK